MQSRKINEMLIDLGIDLLPDSTTITMRTLSQTEEKQDSDSENATLDGSSPEIVLSSDEVLAKKEQEDNGRKRKHDSSNNENSFANNPYAPCNWKPKTKHPIKLSKIDEDKVAAIESESPNFFLMQYKKQQEFLNRSVPQNNDPKVLKMLLGSKR